MPNQTISQLPSLNSSVSGDNIFISHSGTTYRIQSQNLASSMWNLFTNVQTGYYIAVTGGTARNLNITGYLNLYSGVLIKNSLGDRVIDPLNCGLYDNLGGGNMTLDWSKCMLYDQIDGRFAADWNIRGLIDSSESFSLDWNNRLLLDVGEFPSLNWQDKIVYDISNNASLDWGNHLLIGDWTCDNFRSNSYYITTGNSNSRGGKITLNGTNPITISTTAINNKSLINLSINSGVGTIGIPYVSSKVNSVSFSVKSTQVLDNSIISWIIFEGV